MITKTCETCHQPFEIDDSQANEITRPLFTMKRLCDPCIRSQQDEEKAREKRMEERRRLERWYDYCPPLYRVTDLEHKGLNHNFVTAAKTWLEEQWELWRITGTGAGFGLMGNSGGGKTRLLFHCLHKCFEDGASIEATNHHAFSKLVMDAFSSPNEERREKANRDLERLATVDVLLLDDLGKAPSTERCDAELENLIETRGAHLRPILWSANGHGQWLIDRFGPDRGAPIVRRLADFSDVYKA